MMRVSVAVEVALLPAATLTLAGLTAMVKPPAVMVTVNEIVRVTPPPVQVSVAVVLPTTAFAPAVRVSVAVLPVIGLGATAATIGVGKPVTGHDTEPVKPPVRVMVMVPVAEPPCGML